MIEWYAMNRHESTILILIVAIILAGILIGYIFLVRLLQAGYRILHVGTKGIVYQQGLINLRSGPPLSFIISSQ
jgi:hypothetical protein